MDSAPRIEYIAQEELRRMFNEGGLWEMAQRGALIQETFRSRPSGAALPFPEGTMSMIVDYRDPSGMIVARVHQYLLPDGSIGASGRPDPKMVVWEGVSYRVRPEPPKG